MNVCATGMTLDEVGISLRGCFADGQGYTALARARALERIYLVDFDGKAFFSSTAALAFDRKCGASTSES